MEALSDRLSAAQCNGFGGGCFSFASLAKTRWFPDRDDVKVVAAFNAYAYAHGAVVGHAALELPDGHGGFVYLDGDGYPKAWEDIESWGMLDPEDPDWAEFAEDRGETWDDDKAMGVIQVYPDPPQLQAWIDPVFHARMTGLWDDLKAKPSPSSSPRRGLRR